jgi:hypothetical protein
MKVVFHQTVRMHLPVRLLARLPEGGKEQFPVRVISKDGLPPVATIHHVIDSSWIFDPDFPRHAPKHAQTRALCQYVGLTPGLTPQTLLLGSRSLLANVRRIRNRRAYAAALASPRTGGVTFCRRRCLAG